MEETLQVTRGDARDAVAALSHSNAQLLRAAMTQESTALQTMHGVHATFNVLSGVARHTGVRKHAHYLDHPCKLCPAQYDVFDRPPTVVKVGCGCIV